MFRNNSTRFSRATRLAILAAAAGTIGIASAAHADTPLTGITAGDLIVLRGGDSSFSNVSGGNAYNGEVAAYLDEYTPSGTYVGTIDVDSGIAGNADASTLTLPGYGAFQHEGALNETSNGQYITFGGYNAAPSTTASANTNDTVGHNIGVLNLETGTVDTSTQVNGVYNDPSTPYFRGAAPANANATAFYTFGKYQNGGLEYVNGTGSSPAITPIESYADVRNAQVVNNQLYIGSGSSSAASGAAGGHALYSVNGGTPTSQLHTSTQANGVDNTQVTTYNGNVNSQQSASNFAFASITDPSATTDPTSGDNVLYTIGDQNTPGIVKYAWSGSSWVSDGAVVPLNATNILNPTGLSVTIDPTNPSWTDIYVSGQNGLYAYVDKSGNPSAAIGNNAFTLIATPSSNEAFYGVAYASVPEPASVGLIAVGAMGLLARRRARKA